TCRNAVALITPQVPGEAGGRGSTARPAGAPATGRRLAAMSTGTRPDWHGRTQRLELTHPNPREWAGVGAGAPPGQGIAPDPGRLLPRRRWSAPGPRRAALGRGADPDRRRPQGRRPVAAARPGRPAAAGRHGGAGRAGQRAADRADAHPLRAASALRRGVPGL